MAERKSGIYSITNKINGKMYVGMSVNIYKRWETHRTRLKMNKHYNSHLQNSYNKYGIENFEYKILEEITDNEQMADKELQIIKFLELTNPKIGYNKSDERGAILTQKESLKRSAIFTWLKTKQRIIDSGLPSLCEMIKNNDLDIYSYEEACLISDLCNIPIEIVELYCKGVDVDLDSLMKDDRMYYAVQKPIESCNPCWNCARFIEQCVATSFGTCSKLNISFRFEHSDVNQCNYKILDEDNNIFKQIYGEDNVDEVTSKWLRGERI